MRKRRNRNWTPILIVAGAGLVAAVVWAQNGRPNAVRATSAARPIDTAPTVSVALVANRKPLEYYTGGVRADLFTPPEAPPVVAKTAPAKVAPAPVEPPPPPFQDYGYTGSIQMGDQYVALIENVKTKEGQYLKVGDAFHGGIVSRITDRAVEITLAGKTETLSKPEDYKLVPLDRNAPGPTTQTGAPGMPGMPGQPGGLPGMPGMQGAAGAMPAWLQSRMQSMTPEQQQQMQQRFLNRQFNGGGRRGGARGGFGGFGGGGFGGFGFGG
jgi:hypothetical protein